MALFVPDPDGLPVEEMIEQLALEIAARYAAAEDELIREVAARARRHMELVNRIPTAPAGGGLTVAERIRQNRILAELSAHRARSIRELQFQAAAMVEKLRADDLARRVVEIAAREGEAAAAARLGLAGIVPTGVASTPFIGGRAAISTTTLTGTATQAVAAVVFSLESRLEALNQRLTRYPQDAYQRIVSLYSPNTLLGVTTSRLQQAQAVQRFLSEGIRDFTDRANRRWTIGAYAEMAGRTTVNRAFNDAGVWRMQQSGIDLVTVVRGLDSCEKCAAWAGKILSTNGVTGPVTLPHAAGEGTVTVEVAATVDQARNAGWNHPNCRCRLVAYLPGLTIPQDDTTYDPEAEKERAQQRAIERDIRKAKRSEAVAPDEVTAARARRDLREAQADMRGFIRDTGRNRQSYREQLHFADGRGGAAVPPKPAPTPKPAPKAPAASKAPKAAPTPPNPAAPKPPRVPRDPVDVLGPRPVAPRGGTMAEAAKWRESALDWERKKLAIERDNVRIGASKPLSSSDFAAELAKAKNGKAVGESLAKQVQAHGITVKGFTARTNIDTAREYAQTIADLIAKYPTVAMDEINIVRMNPRTYAHVKSTPSTGRVVMEMNTSMATDRAKVIAHLENDVRLGFHPAGLGNIRGVITHEFGHAIDAQTAFAAGKSSRQMLDRLGKSLGIPWPSAEFVEWRKANLPGYAFNRGAYNGTEAIAEAFADYEINGAAANDVSRALWQHLIDGMKP